MNILDKRLEVKGSPAKMVLILAGGILLTALSAMLAFRIWIFDEGDLAQLFGWIGLIFFGAMTLLLVSRFFSLSQPVIIFDRDGLFDTRLSRVPVPWQAIQNVSTWKSNGQKILVLKVPPETEEQVGLSRMARMTRGMNAKLGADGLCVSTNGLKLSHDEIREEVIARVNAAQFPT